MTKREQFFEYAARARDLAEHGAGKAVHLTGYGMIQSGIRIARGGTRLCQAANHLGRRIQDRQARRILGGLGIESVVVVAVTGDDKLVRVNLATGQQVDEPVPAPPSPGAERPAWREQFEGVADEDLPAVGADAFGERMHRQFERLQADPRGPEAAAQAYMDDALGKTPTEPLKPVSGALRGEEDVPR